MREKRDTIKEEKESLAIKLSIYNFLFEINLKILIKSNKMGKEFGRLSPLWILSEILNSFFKLFLKDI